MISGIFHQGSGLGNQLHRYAATRLLAEEKGYEWGMVNPHLFKGKAFMALDTGIDPTRPRSTSLLNTWNEKRVEENGVDIRGYDPEFNFVEDGTVIDGEFQDERYWDGRLDHLRDWFKVEPLDFPDDLCIIGFRGGEFCLFPELFLTKEYWEAAIEMKRKHNPNMRFQVHTDDPALAQSFFPDFQVIHDIGTNWRSVRYAKELIIANSSFYIFPSLLSPAREILAPRYWARRNTRVWALPQNYYSRFTYI